MSGTRFHICVLGCVLLGLIWSGVHPVDRQTWVLEIAPILIVVPLLIITYTSFRLTNMLYCLIACHAVILMVGGHYTYAHVPLFDVLRDMLGTSRNSYDGVGHFAQGFVPAVATREILLRKSGIRSGVLLSVSVVLICLGVSAIYEIIEWGVAVAIGQAADEFLGTQGDVWDTQKDMALAGVGALCAVLFVSRVHDTYLNRRNNA